jgi:hypothetical protein
LIYSQTTCIRDTGVSLPSNPDNAASDLRGASRLIVDAIVGVTDLVESMHRTVQTFGGMFGLPNGDRTGGITGLAYRNVRTVANLVGDGLDTALGPLVSALGDQSTSTEREVVVSALNGVIGDHLVATDNPLAIPMQLRRDGQPVAPDHPTFREALRDADGRILLMVHGSCATDHQWCRNGHDHGASAAEELGYLPLYLRYNSGRHISENGRELADLLTTFMEKLPEDVELTLLTHSMGGLVARSACHYAERGGRPWLDRLRTIVFLGTPHHGAPLERYGNWVDNLLEISPYSAPFARLGKIRSAGVTDMRYGNLLDADWRDHGRFELHPDRRQPVPLPKGVDCYAVAGTSDTSTNRPAEELGSDGMVPVESALGHHPDRRLNLSFPPGHSRVVSGVTHLDLLDNSEVYTLVREWLSD